MEELKEKMMLMHNDIQDLWKNMRHSKGYLEWLNADIGCCIVNFQFQFILNEMTNLPYVQHFQSCSDELDRLFTMYKDLWPSFMLCNNEKILKNVFKEQHQLFTNLVRLRYIVF